MRLFVDHRNFSLNDIVNRLSFVSFHEHKVVGYIGQMLEIKGQLT